MPGGNSGILSTPLACKYNGIKVFKSSIRHNDDEINNSIYVPFVLSNINNKKYPIDIDFEEFKNEFLREVK